MKENFGKAFSFSSDAEGYDSNHPHDDGGHTRYGISKRFHPKMWKNGPPQWKDVPPFYKEEFWDKCRCDELPPGADVVVFDAAIPSGPGDAIRWLQAAVGAKQDGLIGPKTLAAVRRSNPLSMVRKITVSRLRHYAGLSDYKHFGLGWFNRAIKCFDLAACIIRGIK